MDLILVKLCLISALAEFVYSDPLKWVVTESKIPVTLTQHSAVYDGQDSIYLIGGNNETDYNGEVYKYSIRTAEVESVGTLPGRTSGATAFHNNDIYYLGGYSGHYNGYNGHTNITKFSTLTSEWEHVNNIPNVIGIFRMASAWDPVNQVLYTFGGRHFATPVDNIYKYNLGTNEVVQVGLLPEIREGATAVWDNSVDMAYIFGGQTGGSDILEFNANTGNVTKLSARLPRETRWECSIMANDQNAYIVHKYGLMIFNPESREAVEVEIDTGSWPREFQSPGCVYLPHLDRIYVYGGLGYFPGESRTREMNEISYIQLDSPPTTTQTPPTEDCSDGLTKTIRDPFCCYSFYFCHTGRPTKYECLDGEQFNPTTLECEDANNVKCGLYYA